jgi:uncharacterized protein YbjT (DUF2867 family)
MRIAVTGGTGFVGGALVRRLTTAGHEAVVIGRATGIDITDHEALTAAFAGCAAVAHCAGINRELGDQTYQRVHVEGTQTVVEAARAAGVRRIVLMSFLRARPDGPGAYHRSKWQAEQIVRASGLIWTVCKPGVIYGRGDHLLDHLSHSFHTLPVFGMVGLWHRRQLARPIALDDMARVLEAAVMGDERLAHRTVAVLGPETLSLDGLFRRVADTIGRRILFVPLPIAAHLAVAWVTEHTMRVPLIAIAQVRMLQEGLAESLPRADDLPPDLAPGTPFSSDSIRAGLPAPGRFGLGDLRLVRPRERPLSRRSAGRCDGDLGHAVGFADLHPRREGVAQEQLVHDHGRGTDDAGQAAQRRAGDDQVTRREGQ